jgi:uncharacterized protein YjbJ (UPF0337 family)
METENQVPKAKNSTSREDQSVKGKVKEVTGWATGDRDLEAEGRSDGEAAEQVEDEVRTEHGDKGIVER